MLLYDTWIEDSPGKVDLNYPVTTSGSKVKVPQVYRSPCPFYGRKICHRQDLGDGCGFYLRIREQIFLQIFENAKEFNQGWRLARRKQSLSFPGVFPVVSLIGESRDSKNLLSLPVLLLYLIPLVKW